MQRKKIIKEIPVMVAIDAHGMTAVWQNYFGARLQADTTLVLSLQVHI